MQSTVIPTTYPTSTPEELRLYIKAALADPSHTNIPPIAETGDAKLVLDEIWEILDSPVLPRSSRDILRRLILKLATTFNSFPTGLVLQEVTCSDSFRHGEGAYGEVYCGVYNDMKVALKVPRMYVMMRPAHKESLRQSVFRESLIWKHLVHDHILPFIGVSEDCFPGRISMVVPWMENGSLPYYMDAQRRDGKLDDINFGGTISKWLYQVILGLVYLHSEGIVHGDLHPGNLLVDERGSIRISDFGLSLLSDGTTYNYGSLHGGGAVYYTAPELFDPQTFDIETARPTFNSDIYAFGCVCFELYSGTHPFPDLLPHQVTIRVVRGDRPSRPSRSHNDVWILMQRCWTKPEERPSAVVAETCLAGVLSSHFPPDIDPQVQHYVGHLQAWVKSELQDGQHSGLYPKWLERSLARCLDYYKNGNRETISWVLSGYSRTGDYRFGIIPPPNSALVHHDESRKHLVVRYFPFKFKLEIGIQRIHPSIDDYRKVVSSRSSRSVGLPDIPFPGFPCEVLVAPFGALRWVPIPWCTFTLDSLGGRPIDFNETPVPFDEKFESAGMPWITRLRNDQTCKVGVYCVKYSGQSSLLRGRKYDYWRRDVYEYNYQDQYEVLCYAD